MTLNYLEEYKNQCDLNGLKLLKQERSTWIERASSTQYRDLLASLPDITADKLNFSQSEVTIGERSEIDDTTFNLIEEKAKELIGWRKGPFKLFGLDIDAEWRSDQKWERLKDHIDPLQGKTILDIGCNNGYFMFRMADSSPRMVMGIDPVLHYETQFNFLQHFANVPSLHFELFGVEHVNHFKNMFDTIFSMGIIYHHRNPIQQLIDMREALKPGGQLIFETIGIPGEEDTCLFPEERYAKMKNVWFVPTISTFMNWTRRARFIDVEIISVSDLTTAEQRLTPWCPPPHQSLEDFLDPNDPSKTIEGYPAPERFCIKARKRG